jgi:hypothetical protein
MIDCALSECDRQGPGHFPVAKLQQAAVPRLLSLQRHNRKRYIEVWRAVGLWPAIRR